MFFDTHVNLHAEQFVADLPDVLARARAAGVTRFVTICDRLDRFAALRAIADANSDIWCSAGVHPHYAKDYAALTAAELVRMAEDPKVVGVGETGLDQHYGYSDLDAQVRVFSEHIAAAQETGLPIIIHTREADDLTGDLIERAYAHKPFRMLMHCYTGGERLARRALELGAWFSVSGILSFKAAENVRNVIAALPESKVILETDCPYLAPVPHRGRRCEPAFVRDVCQALANLRGSSLEATAELTTHNALQLFDRVS